MPLCVYVFVVLCGALLAPAAGSFFFFSFLHVWLASSPAGSSCGGWAGKLASQKDMVEHNSNTREVMAGKTGKHQNPQAVACVSIQT